MPFKDRLFYADSKKKKEKISYTNQPGKNLVVSRLLASQPAFPISVNFFQKTAYTLIVPNWELSGWGERKIASMKLRLLQLQQQNFTIYCCFGNKLVPFSLDVFKDNHYFPKQTSKPDMQRIARQLTRSRDNLLLITVDLLEELTLGDESDEAFFAPWESILLWKNPISQARLNHMLLENSAKIKNLEISECPNAFLDPFITLPRLITLHVDGTEPPITERDVQRLVSSALRLEKLSLKNITLTKEILSVFNRLKELELDTCINAGEVNFDEIWPKVLAFEAISLLGLISAPQVKAIIERLNFSKLVQFSFQCYQKLPEKILQILFTEAVELETLDLGGCKNLNDSHFSHFKLKKLRKLTFGMNLSRRNLLTILLQNPDLQELKLTYVDWDEPGFTDPSLDSLRLNSLRILDLYECTVDVPFMQAVLEKAINLEVLQARHLNFCEEDQSLKNLKLSQLRTLELPDSQINCTSLQAILAHVNKLEKLNLSRCSNLHINTLTSLNLSRLTSLELNQSTITCASLAALLQQSTCLTTLDLSGCHLNTGILTSVNLVELECLHLDSSHISSAFLKSLLQTAFHLKELFMTDIECEENDLDNFNLKKLEFLTFTLTQANARLFQCLLHQSSPKRLTLIDSSDAVDINYGNMDMSQLTELTISDAGKEILIALLPHAHQLTQLTLNDSPSISGGLPEKLPLDNLVSLSLDNVETVFATSLINSTSQLTHLTLTICNINILFNTDKIKLRPIKAIYLKRVTVSEEAIQKLVDTIPELKELHLESCQNTPDNEFIKNIRQKRPLLEIKITRRAASPAYSEVSNPVENATQGIDAETRFDLETRQVIQHFWGKQRNPEPSVIRQKPFNAFKLNPNNQSASNPFILEHRVESLKMVHPVKISASLYDHFLAADDDHYYGSFPFILTHQWKALPGIMGSETLEMIATPCNDAIEIGFSEKDHFHYIRIKEDIHGPSSPVTIEILLHCPPPKVTLNHLPANVRQLIRNCCDFRNDELVGDNLSTSNDYLQAIIQQRTGACRHRVIAFKQLMSDSEPDILVQMVFNYCNSLSREGLHAFVEVFWNNEWVKCNLRGYECNIVLHDSNAYRYRPSAGETLQPAEELFSLALSDTAERMPSGYLQKAINLTHLKLEKITYFPIGDFPALDTLEINQCQLNIQNLLSFFNRTPNLKILKITWCTMSSGQFKQLDFSSLVLLKQVILTGNYDINEEQLQCVINTAPLKTKWIMEQDTLDASRLVSTNVVIKPSVRTLAKPRYFLNKAKADVHAILNAPWKTGLVNTKDEEGLRIALESLCHATQKPHFYIQEAEELMCSKPFIVKNPDMTGTVKKGPGGVFYDFIQHNPKVARLIVNFTHMSSSNIARFNRLLDKKRQIDTIPIPKNWQIIGLFNPDAPEAYDGTDFSSRFEEEMDFEQELPKYVPSLHHSDELIGITDTVIELCGGEDWDARLFGAWTINEKTLYFQEGKLGKAIDSGVTHIILNNAPLDDAQFLRFLRDTKRYKNKAIFYKGRIEYTIPHKIRFYFTQEISFNDKNTLLDFQGDPLAHKTFHALNPILLSKYLGTYHATGNGGLIQSKGLIEHYTNKKLSVYLTENLSLLDWLKLFESARLHHTTFDICLAPLVQLPEILTPENPATTFFYPQQTPTQWHVNPPKDLPTDAIFIDISELEASDLLETIDHQFDEETLTFNFSEKKGFLPEALKGNKTIVLKGQWPRELALSMHDILVARQQSANASGQLILISEQNDTFPFLTPFINPPVEKANPIHINTAFDKRLETVEQVLDIRPFVLLTGATGSGKTHFVKHIWEKKYPNCHHGEDKILAWINDERIGKKTLFIDEANITQRQWSEFEGLFNNPSGIFYKGHYYPLTPDHKVIFAGNPLSYGGERQTPSLFINHPCAIEFNPIPREEVAKMLNLDKQYAAPILDLIDYVTHLDPEDTFIVPRECLMMANLTKATLKMYPSLSPQAVAQYFAYTLTESHIPSKWRSRFHQKFIKPQPLPIELPPMKNLLINDANRPAVEAIFHHLTLRYFRGTVDKDIDPSSGLGGIILEGEPGVGKSKLVKTLLAALGLRENIDFIYIPASLSDEERKAQLIKAFHGGMIAIIDEINSLSMPERLLNALLEGHDLDEKKADIPGFMLIGTQNPASYGRFITTLPLAHRLQTKVVNKYTDSQALDILLHKGLPKRIALDMIAEFNTHVDYCFRDLDRRAKQWIKHHKEAIPLKLPMESARQIGQICKLVAIENVERYYADQFDYQPIPLRANKENPLSIRKIAKSNGSTQGEVLEFNQWQKNLTDMAFETEVIDFDDDIHLFLDTITKNLQKGNLPLIAFALNRAYGQPDPFTTQPQETEHAAVITGINPFTDEVTLNHWGTTYTVDLINLFNANQVLNATRSREYYQKNPAFRNEKKTIHCQVYRSGPKLRQKLISPPRSVRI